ncbi:hypothetical protein [Actinokineospora xionganensis]|uniref:Uncharacterized protein n=1 Tax=Actinokineospora xionganensis TaxID=2684470 RepID=A0ABR7LF05_9PSEU|nr:hypothetical protein [Actinokineospora xionganensis]MBC6451286.1 hypothetical protein [Actinokineospora xionganensis]
MSLIRKTYAPLPPHTNEDELAEAVLAELDSTFEHQWQVWGTHCSGRRMRVDAVVWPRDPSAWKDDQPVFGIEFKALELVPFDTKNYTAHAAQAVDYTHVDWDDYGHLIVFTCPPPAKGSLRRS